MVISTLRVALVVYFSTASLITLTYLLTIHIFTHHFFLLSSCIFPDKTVKYFYSFFLSFCRYSFIYLLHCFNLNTNGLTFQFIHIKVIWHGFPWFFCISENKKQNKEMSIYQLSVCLIFPLFQCCFLLALLTIKFF